MPTDPVSNPQLPASPGAHTSRPGEASWSEHHHEPYWSEYQGSGPWTDGGQRSSTAAWPALATGLVAGACVGAALALLFAPMRGSAVRSSLRDYASQSGERWSHLVENGRTLAGDAAERAVSLLERGRRALRRAGPAPAPRDGAMQPLTATVAEISGLDPRFEEPLGG